MKPFDPTLYLIADPSLGAARDFLASVRRAVRGGVTLVQFRDKGASPRAYRAGAEAIQKILRPLGIPLILNDHLEIAFQIGASGIHLGQTDADPRLARSRLGEAAIIGLSVGNLAEVRRAPLEVLDYVSAGPIFPTRTKTDAGRPMGPDGLREIRAQIAMPLLAIGGIGRAEVGGVIRAGADGIAAGAALLGRGETRRAARQMLREIQIARRGRPRLLTIAGSDSGGGAGIQADLKTFQALGGYGMSALTALTSQNTRRVKTIFPVPPFFLNEQIDMVVDDIGVDAVKIGMLFSAALVDAVVVSLQRSECRRVVLDPVMVSKSGSPLLPAGAVRALSPLWPHVHFLTPNIREAEILTGVKIRSEVDVENAARRLLEWVPHLVIKGGHLNGSSRCRDLYQDREGDSRWVDYPRIDGPNTHGTGCTLSAAIAAFAGYGWGWRESYLRARAFLQGAIEGGAERRVGQGHGPLDHGWNLRTMA